MLVRKETERNGDKNLQTVKLWLYDTLDWQILLQYALFIANRLHYYHVIYALKDASPRGYWWPDFSIVIERRKKKVFHHKV